MEWPACPTTARSRRPWTSWARGSRAIRKERGVTLTDLAERTGISKSTLSRLENGQRRPSLELLLPLAQAYRVPLDDLVGAPEVADPRIRLKPRKVNGRTVLPLTRQPNGVQAWKILIPARQTRPSPAPTTATSGSTCCRDGCAWSSATATWCWTPARPPSSTPSYPTGSGRTGEGAAEVLSIFGRPGERMHVRARSRREEPAG